MGKLSKNASSAFASQTSGSMSQKCHCHIPTVTGEGQKDREGWRLQPRKQGAGARQGGRMQGRAQY